MFVLPRSARSALQGACGCWLVVLMFPLAALLVFVVYALVTGP